MKLQTYRDKMSGSFSIWREIFGKSQAGRKGAVRVPEQGDVFLFQPERGPAEYAQVIGVYKEAADISHVRYRLYYRYKDKTEDLGEKTLAADLFNRRFYRRIETESAAE